MERVANLDGTSALTDLTFQASSLGRKSTSIARARHASRCRSARTCPFSSMVEHSPRKRAVPVRFRKGALVRTFEEIPHAHLLVRIQLLPLRERCPMVRALGSKPNTPRGFFTRTDQTFSSARRKPRSWWGIRLVTRAGRDPVETGANPVPHPTDALVAERKGSGLLSRHAQVRLLPGAPSLASLAFDSPATR